MAGLCDKAILAPVVVGNLDAFIQACGARVSYSVLYDAVDVFFREGGNQVYISRVVGPGAVIAHANLNDSGAAVSLVANAKSPGAWGNTISVQVMNGAVSGYMVQIKNGATIVESSPDFATQQDAVAWSQQHSSYVTFVLGASANPPAVAAAVTLGSGSDDRSNITDVQWQTALDRFTADLGPGQVLSPGRTSSVGHQQLEQHAGTHNRVALLDLPDSYDVTALSTSAGDASSTGDGQYAASYAPWVVVPGVVPGTTRTVPMSAAVAGLTARVDAVENPNTPAAGKNGELRYAIGLSQPVWSDSQRSTLNLNGVNVVRPFAGTFRVYGCRSLADPVLNPDWLDFSNVRYLMWLSARCQEVGESFVFEPIDGQGHTISDFGAALTAVCQLDWSAGIIYGQTASDAFSVDVGSFVNTPQTIADNQLRAVVAVRPSPFAELVTIVIVNVPSNEAVA
jgi:phage tail sheath protein FI